MLQIFAPQNTQLLTRARREWSPVTTESSSTTQLRSRSRGTEEGHDAGGAVHDEVRAALPAIGATLDQDGFRGRTRGIGVLTPAQVRQYGVSGPAARACGVDFDLRRDEPYLAYAELAGALRVPVRAEAPPRAC